MTFDVATLARAAFKRINTRAHTANSKELANEAIASSITLTFESIIGEQISPTGSQAVADGVALHLSGAHVLSATLDITSNGKAYILTVPSGNLLIGQPKPGGGTFQFGDRAQRIIPQSFGLDFRPVLRSNGVEVPPFDTRDWYLDEFAGIITSEDDLSLLNGTVECYAYIGQYLNQVISSGSASSAPISASYVTINTEPGLPNERVLTAGSGITITDNGPGGSVIVAVNLNGSVTSPICNEVPSGALNNVNTQFTILNIPSDPSCVQVYVNGQRQKSGSSCDYILTGSDSRIVSMSYALRPVDNIFIDYFITGSVGVGGGSADALTFSNSVFQEIPSGAIDGVNDTFTLSFPANPVRSVLIFRSGMAQMSGSSFDYLMTNPSTIVFNVGAVPPSGSNIFVHYNK